MRKILFGLFTLAVITLGWQLKDFVVSKENNLATTVIDKNENEKPDSQPLDYARNFQVFNGPKIDFLVTEPIKVNNNLLKNGGVLTSNKVIEFTNKERISNGLKALSINIKLNETAQKKLKDLINKNYFAHVSPDKKDLIDISKEVGYNFILIGENLAYGDFKDEENLVKAWMASKAHRANILNKSFSEIGVALAKDKIDDKETWIVVEHFGLPAQACPAPSIEDNKLIEEYTGRIDELKKELQLGNKGVLASIINAVVNRNQINEYNSLIKETQVLINKYNNQVNLYNNCLEKISTQGGSARG